MREKLVIGLLGVSLLVLTACASGAANPSDSTSSFLTTDARFTIVEQDGARYLKAMPWLISPQTDFTITEAN